MALRLQYLSICLLLTLFEIVQPVYSIKGPTYIRCSIGEDALFMWNTTDQKEILSARWGIRKGTIPDPQFISVNGYNGKVHLNEDIDAALKKRVEFLGNLTIGRAWFVLKNLTVNDAKEYIASISDNVSIVLPYPVRLIVAEKGKEKPKEGPSATPHTTAAAPNNTTTPKQNSSNILRHIKGHMILMGIALVMWHS